MERMILAQDVYDRLIHKGLLRKFKNNVKNRDFQCGNAKNAKQNSTLKT